MNRDGPASMLPPQWGDRFRGAQFGFVGGLVIGLLLGWFFHGVISTVVRLGFLALLLLPLLVIGWLWLRSRRGSVNGEAGRPPVMTTWTAVGTMTTRTPSSSPPETGVLIDVPVAKPRSESRPADIEAELDALKARQERES